MQAIDFEHCEVIETPFYYNGSKWVNICVRDGEQEFNFEFKDLEENI